MQETSLTDEPKTQHIPLLGSSTSQSPVNILLVDDQQANLVALEAVLAGNGYTVICASSGQEALQRAMRLDIAVILSDVMMPEMDGFELARVLKSHDRTRTIPIIFVTAMANGMADVYRGYAAGAVDYLPKPLEPEIVRAKVSTFVDLYRQRRVIEFQARQLQEHERLERERLRKTADDQRRTLEERLNVALNGSPLVLYNCDARVDIDLFYELIHPGDRERTRRAIDASIGALSGYDIEYRTVDPATGAVKWIRAIGKTFTDARGKPIRFDGVTLDVTARNATAAKMREQEDALKSSEARFRTLTDTMPQIAWIGHPDGTAEFFNRRWYEYTGLTEAESAGAGWLSAIHPDDASASRKAWHAALRDVSIYNVECRYRRAADDSYRWHLVRALPVVDEQGKLTHWIGTSTDIDEHKRSAEILEQRVDERTAQLAAANRELESFSYSVSHDLRAPLRGIDGFSELLLKKYEGVLDQEGQGYLNRVRAAAGRMSKLIDELLDLSRITRREMRRGKVNLSTMALQISGDLALREPGRKVRVEVAPELVVDGDPVLLRAMLENLIGNAWKFTSGHDTATIELGWTDVDGRRVLFVRDDGAGFDMTYVEKLFGAFQRLHAARDYPGSGIGLATVQRIVNRHGGRIWAEGEVEKGATFYFTLG